MEQTTIQIVPESEIHSAISETDQIIEITDVGIIGLDSLCRLCSNRSDNLISIYEGEGLEYQLQYKMNQYLPFQVEQVDSMPNHCCYQCASTLLSWHELYETSMEADRRLKALQQDLQRISIYEEQEAQTVVEEPTENCITITTSPDQRVAQSRAPGFLSFRQAQTNFTVEYLTQCIKQNNEAIQSINLKLETVDDFGTFEPSINISQNHIKPEPSKDFLLTNNTISGLDDSCLSLIEINPKENKTQDKTITKTKTKIRSRKKTPNSKPFCSICKIIFKRPIDLRRHSKIHLNSIKNTTTKKEDINSVKLFVCKFCNKHFEDNADLQKHIVSHSDEKFLRNKCNRFKNSDFDDTNNIITATDMIDNSKIKDEDSSDDVDFTDKGETQTVHTALKTNKLICRNKLNKDEIEQARIIIDKRTYYQCKECGKNLHSPYTYMWHCRIHTGERPYVCDLCGKQFRVSQGLVRHLRETHAGIKNFPCDLCGRMFATRRNVEEHRRIHTNERPYVCDLCGKAFKQKASLFVHNRSHTDSFPHKCSYCGQGFRTKPPLMIHVTRHTGEKPFPCEICGRCFRIKYELKRHRLIHSDEKPFSCTECGISFRQKRYLRNHNKINHNSRITI